MADGLQEISRHDFVGAPGHFEEDIAKFWNIYIRRFRIDFVHIAYFLSHLRANGDTLLNPSSPDGLQPVRPG